MSAIPGCYDHNVLIVRQILAVVKGTMGPWDLEAYSRPSAVTLVQHQDHVRPPWRKTSTGFFAFASPGFFVQTFSFKQSSDAGLLFCATKFFQTRKPDGCVKFGKALTGGLLEGQSLCYVNVGTITVSRNTYSDWSC